MAASGRTATTKASTTGTSKRRLPLRDVPLVRLPGAVADLAASAVAPLGWGGTVLPETTVLGRKVCLVARIRPDAHAERIATGIGPVTDRAEVATWMWPELVDSAPPEAVELVGVLTVTRHWRTAMASVVPFARYGDAAMVLPAEVTMSTDYVDNCLPRARVYGLSVVTVNEDTGADLDLGGRGAEERMLLDRDQISRWVNELAYSQLLEHAADPCHAKQ